LPNLIKKQAPTCKEKNNYKKKCPIKREHLRAKMKATKKSQKQKQLKPTKRMKIIP
jgi:hypothetical protein